MRIDSIHFSAGLLTAHNCVVAQRRFIVQQTHEFNVYAAVARIITIRIYSLAVCVNESRKQFLVMSRLVCLLRSKLRIEGKISHASQKNE